MCATLLMVKGTDVGLAVYLRTHGSAISPSGCRAFGGKQIPLRRTKTSLHIIYIYISCKNANSFSSQTMVRSFLIYFESLTVDVVGINSEVTLVSVRIHFIDSRGRHLHESVILIG